MSSSEHRSEHLGSSSTNSCSIVSSLPSNALDSSDCFCVVETSSNVGENRSRNDSSVSTGSSTLSSSSREIDYDSEQIKNCLLNQTNKYQIIKNESSASALWWRAFGSPARFDADNILRKIPGFISCLKCMHTQAYGSSSGTKRFQQHADKCFLLSSSTTPAESRAESSMVTQRTLEQVGFNKSVNIHQKDIIKIKDLSAEWICGDLRPFSILDDPGFRNLAQECVRLGEEQTASDSVLSWQRAKL